MALMDIPPATTPSVGGVQSANYFAGSTAPYVRSSRQVRISPDGAPLWAAALELRINELLSLGANWDTYGAAPIDLDNVLSALKLLATIGGRARNCPLPATVPTAARGVQFEWESADDRVVIARADDSGVCIYVADDEGELEGRADERLIGRAAATIGLIALG